MIYPFTFHMYPIATNSRKYDFGPPDMDRKVMLTISSCLIFFSQAGKLANRLFYLSIPPNIFVDVARCASLRASSADGWTRVIVEKPFGRDSKSSGELTRCLKQYLCKDQIFR